MVHPSVKYILQVQVWLGYKLAFIIFFYIDCDEVIPLYVKVQPQTILK